MKVAMLSPVAWRTPPVHYGPWEQVASNITEGMVGKGVDMTLFATGESITKGHLHSITHRGYAEDGDIDPKVVECLHISEIMERAGEFDLIHNNFDFLPLTYSKLIEKPIVTTIHGFSSEKIIRVYEKYNNRGHYVSISNANRSSRLNYAATVYNGLNTNEFTLNRQGGDYLLFFGRIHPDKGTYESIEIAKKAKKKLIISGIIQDEQYFKEQVQPFINDDDIVFVGSSGPEKRNKLMGEALALLHPIGFEEPFGLSVAESMLCGTPVLAFNKGSMPELIQQGKTGFLTHTVEETVEAIQQLQSIDRTYCRTWSAENFSLEKMVEDYYSLYQTILS